MANDATTERFIATHFLVPINLSQMNKRYAGHPRLARAWIGRRLTQLAPAEPNDEVGENRLRPDVIALRGKTMNGRITSQIRLCSLKQKPLERSPAVSYKHKCFKVNILTMGGIHTLMSATIKVQP
ncbi:hypothetical protein JZ751_029457 [Albula glossodonta]|uniref:Uncharacterized protein n=1 Tax=Albula glossodonta TaxID=121402 RepID=A0A8T2PJP2_9TELE|nr:hypothetical protein JZ751_029457 [Albula glossodonta]